MTPTKYKTSVRQRFPGTEQKILTALRHDVMVVTKKKDALQIHGMIFCLVVFGFFSSFSWSCLVQGQEFDFDDPCVSLQTQDII